MIFCLSNIHTGTWTTLAWLVLHKEVNGLMLSTHVQDVLRGIKTPENRQESGTYYQKFDPSMVYHEHVRPDHLFPDKMSRTQVVMATTNPTVIPVRDPLLSLISYQNRAVIHGKTGGEGFLPTEHVLNRWVYLAEQFDILSQFDHIQFLCWDLLGINAESTLWGVAKNLGLKDRKPSTVGGQLENNQTGGYDLKFHYVARNVPALRQGMSGDGFQELVNRERILRPFLEGIGYTNLMWWS